MKGGRDLGLMLIVPGVPDTTLKSALDTRWAATGDSNDTNFRSARNESQSPF